MKTWSVLGASCLAFASLVSGCACDAVVGVSDRDASVDAWVAPRTDQCGNGTDDDLDGRLDEGCPCGPGEVQSCFSGALASRTVGLCADGMQVCVASGVEWGDWGNSACEGSVVPATEQCDGMDHDCDGAIDEGCPCTAGQTRGCGTEFVVEPCTPGTQTCSADGTWSSCVGAIGPMPDVCDGIDNDCDTRPDVGCWCTPEPEICRDGMDNDCDGDTDEVECRPDWPRDAGVPDDAGGPLDGGPCTGTACDLPAPRPIAPLSTSSVTSRRPTLRWLNTAGVTEARVELCLDRACARPLMQLDGTDSVRPSADLPSGWVFWRLRARAGSDVGATVSATWQLWVGARSADGDRDTSWGSVLDVNGDGYADVAVGAHQARDVRGSAHVFLGGPGGVSTTASTVLIGGAGDRLGQSALSAGDVNGDGFADLMVGAPNATVGGMFGVGKASVFHGGPSGISTTPTIVLNGTWDTGYFGLEGVAMGDENGDGYADLAISAMSATVGGRAYTGIVAVYRGSPTGISSTPTFVLEGAAANDGFGSALASGDLDGDGRDDLVVGAGSNYPADTRAGTVSVFRGGATGLGRTPSQVLNGNLVGDQFGQVLAVGDPNGDGYADLAVTALAAEVPDFSSTLPGTDAGIVSVFFGGASGVATTAHRVYLGTDFSGRFGCSLSFGDVDGDGRTDLAIGALQHGRDGNGDGRGGAWVYIATATGLPATPTTMREGSVMFSAFGVSLAMNGDADGDGRADLVVGVMTADPGGVYEAGAVEIFPGMAGGVAATRTVELVGFPDMIGNFGIDVAL